MQKSFKRVKKVIMDRGQKPLNKTLYKVLGNNNFADIQSKQHHWEMATGDCIFNFILGIEVKFVLSCPRKWQERKIR